MMELVEHRRGVQRLSSDHQDHQPENVDSRVNGVSIRGPKDHGDPDQEMSDCDSETSEVLSVGSEPMPNADGMDVDRVDPRSVDNYESDAGTNIATRGLNSSRERNRTRNNERSTLVASSPSSRSPSPSPSSSGSCNPPQSPVSNYCVTPPQRQPSPSSPTASSVRSPASSSATASSPGRPDAHPEAIVPRYQSAGNSLLHQNLLHNHHHHQHPHQPQHLHLTGRYAAAAIVSTTRDTGDLVDYPSVVGASTLTRLPGIIGHHAVGLTGSSHGTPSVADLIGYSQQSIETSRLHGRPSPSAINVPLVTRLSLSPPTAMTVTGLQPSTPGTAFHPVAVAAAAAAAAAAGRDPREASGLLAGHPGHLQHSGHGITAVQHPLLQAPSSLQHVGASTTVLNHHHHSHQPQHSPHHRQNSSNASPAQHRLSVSKLLQHNSQDSPRARESGSPMSPRGDDHLHQNNHLHEVTRSNTSPGSNLLQNSSGVSVTNNNSNHQRNNNNSSGNNNNNNVQNQSSLKFSIDNILKADFGRRITEPISLKKSRPKKVVPRPIDLTKDFLETSSEGSDRGSETSTTNPSPGVPNTGTSANSGNTTGNNGTGGGSTTSSGTSGTSTEPAKQMLWPAWVYCTRYSDRPSSGPRTRRVKRPSDTRGAGTTPEEKRPRTAFSGEQLARLKREFAENRYLTERRRQQLSRDLGLNEAQIKIWFQNKRAKIKKASGQKNPLALQLMAQGLYNHSTVPLTKEEEEQAAELQAK